MQSVQNKALITVFGGLLMQGAGNASFGRKLASVNHRFAEEKPLKVVECAGE
jgi:hypothetical protein